MMMGLVKFRSRGSWGSVEGVLYVNCLLDLMKGDCDAAFYLIAHYYKLIFLRLAAD